MSAPLHRLTLSDLPLAGRVTLAVFLCAVGLGYFAALVQLHVQQAKPGQVLPSDQQVIDTYHGRKGVSVLERLITADEHLPFSSSGSMRVAFTTRSRAWTGELKKRTTEIAKLQAEDKDNKRLVGLEETWRQRRNGRPLTSGSPGAREVAELEMRLEREGEAAALAAWIQGGADKQSYEDDAFVLPEALQMIPEDDYVIPKSDDGKPKRLTIRTLIDNRCCRCHKENTTDPAREAPLDTYERITAYTSATEGETGMPLRKLAQSTHVHLLGFSVLYGLTGLIFACSAWPGILRLVIAPLPLFAQVVDISFWWLARLHDPYGPDFARCIRYSGMVVGGSLGLQIVLGLFSLFGWFGRFVLLLLFAGAAVGAYYVNDLVIAPYLLEQAKLAVP